MESQQIEAAAAAALEMMKVLDITSQSSKRTRESCDDRPEVVSGNDQTVDWLADLDKVEEILRYEFKNKKLLEEAFTHASFSDKCFSYERLEYVGDSVLNLVLTKEQYFMYPDLPPGALTRLRSANVNTEKLARVAIKHQLHRYLRHKKPLLEEQEVEALSIMDKVNGFFTCFDDGSLEKQIREFSQAILEYPLHSNGLVDVPKALADIVEAAMGAVFIDSNFSIETVWKTFKDLLEPMISQETLRLHPVTELYEACQKRNLKLRFVDLWEEHMAFDVLIDDQFMGRGIYGPKKEIAHNRAANDALNNIEKVFGKKDSCSHDFDSIN